MAARHVFLQTCLIVASLSSAKSDYWSQRSAILRVERSANLGGRLTFESGERIANIVLMTQKRAEIDRGFEDPSKFPPARNFLDAKSDIEESEVYRIIRRMPKGGVLHAHDTAIVSSEWVFENITYRDDLYVCDKDDEISLRFFTTPDDGTCDWRLLSDVRRDDESGRKINDRIRRRMSMNHGNSSGSDFADGNEAWKKFSDIFAFITPFLTYVSVYEDHYYQGLRELYEDNVMYLELRSTLPTLYDLDGTTYGPLDVARIYQRVTERFVRDHPDFFGAKLIYAPIKTSDREELEKFLKIAVELKREMPDFFAGFDLVGQEDTSKPLKEWVNEIRAADPGMEFFFHAGETNWNGRSVDENLVDAVLMNSKRIGHGYALTKHPVVLELVKRKQIAIEICPISNQVLALVKDMRNHPASQLFVDDVPIVVSNDDPGLWGSTALSYDFYEAFVGIMSAQADIRSLKQLAINSLMYSSLNESEKSRAFLIWQKQWQEFLRTFHTDRNIHHTVVIVKTILGLYRP